MQYLVLFQIQNDFYDKDKAFSPFTVPTHWKNGIAFSVAGQVSHGSLNGIAVSGSDIFLAGNTYNLGETQASCWKNNSAVRLSVGAATAIGLAGENVYIAGSVISGDHGIALYWKNGVQDNLSDGLENEAANAICLVKK